MSDQDWTTVVFRKKVTPAKVNRNVGSSGGGLNTGDYTTVKKTTAGRNSGASSKPRSEPSHLRKIADTELDKIPKVSGALRQGIAQGRSAKSLTQKDLAQKLNVKVQIIQDYENGKAIPDGKFISRIEKVLETQLPGK